MGSQELRRFYNTLRKTEALLLSKKGMKTYLFCSCCGALEPQERFDGSTMCCQEPFTVSWLEALQAVEFGIEELGSLDLRGKGRVV